MDEFGRLNDAELEILRLLAEGHTAKSIAGLTGRSVAAVNERLRDARRKTGIGSSRELARAVRAQESWDKQMGMASAMGAEASKGRDASPPRKVSAGRKGWIVMIPLAIAALAAASLVLDTGTSPDASTTQPERRATSPASNDPLLSEMFRRPEENEPRRLHERVRTEPRDAAWADRAEAALRARYESLSRAGRVDDLRVICASTACEAAGSIIAKGETINPTVQAIQDRELVEPLPQVGLVNQGAGFGHGPNPGQQVFFTYWLRSGGSEADRLKRQR